METNLTCVFRGEAGRFDIDNADASVATGIGEDYARLFAAAPDLLEALLDYKRLYEEVQPAGGWQGVYEMGNYAINKATGGN